MGREVATLVNEELKPGTYTVNFSTRGGSLPVRQAGAFGGDTTHLSSDVYFYRLVAGKFSQMQEVGNDTIRSQGSESFKLFVEQTVWEI